MKKICCFMAVTIILGSVLIGCSAKKSIVNYYDRVYAIDGTVNKNIIDAAQNKRADNLNELNNTLLKIYEDGEKELKKIHPPQKTKEAHEIILKSYNIAINNLKNVPHMPSMVSSMGRIEWYAKMKKIFIEEKIQKEVIVDGTVFDKQTAEIFLGKPPSVSSSPGPMTTTDLQKLSDREEKMYSGRQKAQSDFEKLATCKTNLKNIANALAMYANDNNGRYPSNLNELFPNYLQKIPECPAAGFDTYSTSYQHKLNPEAFILYCNGNYHPSEGLNRPYYNSQTGLVEK